MATWASPWVPCGSSTGPASASGPSPRASFTNPLMLSDLRGAFCRETGSIAVQEPESISGFVYQDGRLRPVVAEGLLGPALDRPDVHPEGRGCLPGGPAVDEPVPGDRKSFLPLGRLVGVT